MKQVWAIDIGEKFKLGQKCYYDRGVEVCEPMNIRDIFPDLGTLISTLLPNVYIVASVILFVFLIFGGFTYIVSAGQKKPEGVQQGRNAIGTALIGFLLIFASWWIIEIIEAITGIDILQPNLPN